jgi:hypothetical protein
VRADESSGRRPESLVAISRPRVRLLRSSVRLSVGSVRAYRASVRPPEAFPWLKKCLVQRPKPFFSLSGPRGQSNAAPDRPAQPSVEPFPAPALSHEAREPFNEAPENAHRPSMRRYAQSAQPPPESVQPLAGILRMIKWLGQRSWISTDVLKCAARCWKIGFTKVVSELFGAIGQCLN